MVQWVRASRHGCWGPRRDGSNPSAAVWRQEGHPIFNSLSRNPKTVTLYKHGWKAAKTNNKSGEDRVDWKKRTGSLRISWKWWPKPLRWPPLRTVLPHSITVYLISSYYLPFLSLRHVHSIAVISPFIFLLPFCFSIRLLLHPFSCTFCPALSQKFPSIFPTVRFTFILWFLFSFVSSPRTFQ